MAAQYHLVGLTATTMQALEAGTDDSALVDSACHPSRMEFTKDAAVRFGRWNRRRKLRHVLALIRRSGASRVLLVGIAPGANDYDNLIEREVARTVPGTVGVGLAAKGPDWIEYVQADALALPFEPDEFDVVFSNAVIEHVGDATAQRHFVNEHDRVGRSWMLTTPNRAFPIEAHDRTFVRHWSPNWQGSRSGSVTRLVTPRDLRQLLPMDARIQGGWLSPTLTAYLEAPDARSTV